MKTLKKILVILPVSLLMFTQCEAMDITSGIYMIPGHYDNAPGKTDTTVKGIYAYFGEKEFALETEFDLITQSKNNTLVQQNIGAIYTQFLPGMQIKAGGFYLFSPSEKSVVGILGTNIDQYNDYGYKTYSYGTDVFLSIFNPGTQQLVVQASPYSKAYFSPPFWQEGYFEWTGKVHLIDNVSSKKLLGSGESSLAYNLYPFSVTGTVYLGPSSYGCYNGGFVIYNSDDLILNGVGVSMTYSLSPQWSMTAGYQVFNQESTDVPNTFTLSKMTYMTMVTF